MLGVVLQKIEIHFSSHGLPERVFSDYNLQFLSFLLGCFVKPASNDAAKR